MYKVKFEYDGKKFTATAKDVSSYDAAGLRIIQRNNDGTFEQLDPEYYDEIADEAIELLYEAKYGKELMFEVG